MIGETDIRRRVSRLQELNSLVLRVNRNSIGFQKAIAENPHRKGFEKCDAGILEAELSRSNFPVESAGSSKHSATAANLRFTIPPTGEMQLANSELDVREVQDVSGAPDAPAAIRAESPWHAHRAEC
jgi:hypothetical protein